MLIRDKNPADMLRVKRQHSDRLLQLLGFLALCALGIVLLFSRLGASPLCERDESRYAEIAREMLASGDFVVPQWNYVPYLAKPPLSYWLTCVAYKLFGVNEFAARFFPALSGLLCILAVYFIGRELFNPNAAFRAGLVLATGLLFFFVGRRLVIDMELCAAMTLALACFTRQLSSDRRFWPWAFYAFMGLAFMLKGPVGAAIPLGVAAAFLLLTEGVRGLRRLLSPGGMVCFAVICLPWHIAILHRHPEYFRYFFLHENVMGFLRGGVHHPGRWFDVLYYAIVGFMPWTFLLPGALKLDWKRLDKGGKFCLIWAGIVIALFTLSASKLITYVLPAMPALALLVGRSLPGPWGKGLSSRIRLAVAVVLSAAVVSSLVFFLVAGVDHHTLKDAGESLRSAVRNIAWCWLTLAVVGAATCLFRPGRFSFIACALFLPLTLVPALKLEEAINEELSTKNLCRVIQRRGNMKAVFTFYKDSQPTIFYMQRPVPIVGYVPREFRFGRSLGDYDHMFPTIETVKRLASSTRGIYCLVRADLIKAFQDHLGDLFRPVVTEHSWTVFESIGRNRTGGPNEAQAK